MTEDGVGFLEQAGVARITLSRPEVKNALDRSTWAAFARAVAAAKKSAARVIVVEGAGGAFSAGGDLKSIEERLVLPSEARRAQLTADAQGIRELVEIGRPTLALIDGPAMGAGLAIALACDLRLASARSRLSCAFRKVGLAADFGVSWLLPRLVGRGRALDLLYSGELLSADAAKAYGLVERVYSDERWKEDSEAYVQALATGPAALRIIRRVVDEVGMRSLAESIEIEAGGQAEASRTKDARSAL